MNMKNTGLSAAAMAVAVMMLAPVQPVEAQPLPPGAEELIGDLLTCTQLINQCLNTCGGQAVVVCYKNGPTTIYLCRCL